MGYGTRCVFACLLATACSLSVEEPSDVEQAIPAAGAGTLQIQSRVTASTTFTLPTTDPLCIGVDARRPIRVAGFDAVYPVIVTACSVRGVPTVGFRYTSARELRMKVNGTEMCLTRKKPFSPYRDAYLAAFADLPYIETNYYPENGTITDTYSPMLMATCKSVDGDDEWDFDPEAGTLATYDNLCATIMHNSMSISPGMPYLLWSCVANKASRGLEHQQVSLGSAQPWVGTFTGSWGRWPKGTVGLPIMGPLGKCLTTERTNNVRRVVLSDCDGRQEQLFQSRGAHIYTSAAECLERAFDGSVEVHACTTKSTQTADYRIPSSEITSWKNASLYGELKVGGSCLTATDNLFSSPSKQRTPVVASTCTSGSASLRSWYVQTRLRSLRIQALRMTDDDGTRGTGITSDYVAGWVGILNRQYERLGLRFIYNPATDFTEFRNTNANTLGWGPTFSTDGAGSRAIDLAAANTHYGKIVIAFARGRLGGMKKLATDAAPVCDTLRGSASWQTPEARQRYVESLCGTVGGPITSSGCAYAVLVEAFGSQFSSRSTPADVMADMQCDASGTNCKKTVVDEVNAMCDFGGGWSSSCNNQAAAAQMIDPITSGGCSVEANMAGFQRSADGYPAESYSIVLGWSDPSNIVHEMGHYLGLDHTFTGEADLILDTPADPTTSYWDGLSIDRCGNPEGPVGTMPTDRRNAMNYFGCFFLPSLRAFSPQQAGKIDWKLTHQPNRTQLQGCKPTADYDPYHVTCTTQRSYTQCVEASSVVSGLTCAYHPSGGGIFSALLFSKARQGPVGREAPGRNNERR